MIITKSPYESNVFSEWASTYYGICMNRPLPARLPALPVEILTGLSMVYCGARQPLPECELITENWPAPAKVHQDLFVVGSAGGKDALAVAHKLRSEGMRGVFFHTRGTNPCYPTEYKSAMSQAQTIKCGYAEMKIKIGKKSYLENPARNHCLLLLQMSCALNIGASVVVQGLHSNRVAETQPFVAGWSDCVEMAQAGKEMVESMAPWVTNRITNLPQSDTESLDYMVEHIPDLLPEVQSCMLPVWRLPHVRQASCRRVGYELLPRRCGSCYKCIREWIVLKEHGYYKLSPAYEEYSLNLVVKKHAPFCYGPVARTWSREKILKAFLSRPSKERGRTAVS